MAKTAGCGWVAMLFFFFISPKCFYVVPNKSINWFCFSLLLFSFRPFPPLAIVYGRMGVAGFIFLVSRLVLLFKWYQPTTTQPDEQTLLFFTTNSTQNTLKCVRRVEWLCMVFFSLLPNVLLRPPISRTTVHLIHTWRFSSAKRVLLANRQLQFSSPLLFSSDALRFALQNKVKHIKQPPLLFACPVYRIVFITGRLTRGYRYPVDCVARLLTTQLLRVTVLYIDRACLFLFLSSSWKWDNHSLLPRKLLLSQFPPLPVFITFHITRLWMRIANSELVGLYLGRQRCFLLFFSPRY